MRIVRPEMDMEAMKEAFENPEIKKDAPSSIMATKGKLENVATIPEEELVDPNTLRVLPAKYNLVMGDPTIAERMHAFGSKLSAKHPNWKKERIMRKLFEAFPSVRIKILEDDIS